MEGIAENYDDNLGNAMNHEINISSGRDGGSQSAHPPGPTTRQISNRLDIS
jgi:hypothetical protein